MSYTTINDIVQQYLNDNRHKRYVEVEPLVDEARAACPDVEWEHLKRMITAFIVEDDLAYLTVKYDDLYIAFIKPREVLPDFQFDPLPKPKYVDIQAIKDAIESDKEAQVEQKTYDQEPIYVTYSEHDNHIHNGDALRECHCYLDDEQINRALHRDRAIWFGHKRCWMKPSWSYGSATAPAWE